MRYADNTTVPVAKSRAEIEQLVLKYAGRDTNFSFGQMKGQAAILFDAFNRRVKFTLPLPTAEEGLEKAGRKRSRQTPSLSQVEAWRDKEERRRWRALLLSIKAKLESVNSGICTFEEEFLSHICPGGGDQTIYERMMAGPEHKLLAPLPEEKTRPK